MYFSLEEYSSNGIGELGRIAATVRSRQNNNAGVGFLDPLL
jgi:hypothetical protein